MEGEWPAFTNTKPSQETSQQLLKQFGIKKKKTTTQKRNKNAVVCEYLQNVSLKSLRTLSVHLFAIWGVFVVGRDVGESHVLWLGIFLVALLSLHVEANHQLVDDDTDDGAEERGKDGHQEPTVSSPKKFFLGGEGGYI